MSAKEPKGRRSTASDSRQRVLDSAREEIRKNGILGLRVADVASNAFFAVSVIYRHFGDRDGLLAAVLGDIYEELMTERRQILSTRLPAEGPLTMSQIVRLAPSPSEVLKSNEVRLRLQILAVAATNPALEERLSQIAQREIAEMHGIIEYLQSRLPEGQTGDMRVFSILIANQSLYYNHLLGPLGVDDETYYAFLEEIALKYAEAPQQ